MGKPRPTPRQLLVLVIVQNTVFAVLGAYLWLRSGEALATLLAIDVGSIAIGLALALLLIGIARLSYLTFPKFSQAMVKEQAAVFTLFGRNFGWPGIVLVSVAAGIGEEMLFRAGVQSLAVRFAGPAFGIAAAAVLFALVHLNGARVAAILTGAGAIFGVVFWLTGDLVAVALAHALYDVWALRFLHRELVRGGYFEEALAG